MDYWRATELFHLFDRRTGTATEIALFGSSFLETESRHVEATIRSSKQNLRFAGSWAVQIMWAFPIFCTRCRMLTPGGELDKLGFYHLLTAASRDRENIARQRSDARLLKRVFGGVMHRGA